MPGLAEQVRIRQQRSAEIDCDRKEVLEEMGSAENSPSVQPHWSGAESSPENCLDTLCRS